MAFLVTGLLAQVIPAFGFRRRNAVAEAPARTLLRGASRRAYSVEVHAREAVSALRGVAAVYCYARTLAGDDGAARDNPDFAIGYIAQTADMAARHAEHERLQHFAGQDFDVVLLVREALEIIRADIERDLLQRYDPPLNELLRGHQPGPTESD
ncbi:MAG TPA: hypothetical protein VG900_00025 [Hyphomicrobiaceae bacterium]|jgi:hypothetical protein|nr:hypothetical protein [Hyphomicrobiaceae bacterium]